ncbi:MAG: AraC family ligand binding domain-containing protein [Planctomycetota bacterium]
MEKPTQYSGDSGSIVEPPSRWFRALMGVMASYELKNVLLPSGRLSPDGPVKNESEPARRHVTSLHSHKYPEICVCVRGQAMMELEDGLHEMSSPSIFFALPGTPHCQAATRDDLPHALSWLAYSSEAILCNSSIFTPGEGWEDSHRGSLEGEDVRGLSQVLEELRHAVPAPRSEPGEGEEQGRSRDGSPIPLEMMRIIRAKLINVTNRMYQRAVRSQNNHKEERRGSLEYHKPVLRYVRAYIDDNLDQRSTLGELGEMARLSPN